MTEPLLQVDNLNVEFSTDRGIAHALNGVSVSIEPGETLAVVGESGVGDLKKVETGSDATRFAFEKSLNRRALAEGRADHPAAVRAGKARRDDGPARRNRH